MPMGKTSAGINATKARAGDRWLPVQRTAMTEPSAKVPPGTRMLGKSIEYGVTKKMLNPLTADAQPSANAESAAIARMACQTKRE